MKSMVRMTTVRPSEAFRSSNKLDNAMNDNTTRRNFLKGTGASAAGAAAALAITSLRQAQADTPRPTSRAGAFATAGHLLPATCYGNDIDNVTKPSDQLHTHLAEDAQGGAGAIWQTPLVDPCPMHQALQSNLSGCPTSLAWLWIALVSGFDSTKFTPPSKQASPNKRPFGLPSASVPI